MLLRELGDEYAAVLETCATVIRRRGASLRRAQGRRHRRRVPVGVRARRTGDRSRDGPPATKWPRAHGPAVGTCVCARASTAAGPRLTDAGYVGLCGPHRRPRVHRGPRRADRDHGQGEGIGRRFHSGGNRLQAAGASEARGPAPTGDALSGQRQGRGHAIPTAAERLTTQIGGRSGIRTHETLARPTVFKTVAFVRSATLPGGTLPGRQAPFETIDFRRTDQDRSRHRTGLVVQLGHFRQRSTH